MRGGNLRSGVPFIFAAGRNFDAKKIGTPDRRLARRGLERHTLFILTKRSIYNERSEEGIGAGVVMIFK